MSKKDSRQPLIRLLYLLFLAGSVGLQVDAGLAHTTWPWWTVAGAALALETASAYTAYRTYQRMSYGDRPGVIGWVAAAMALLAIAINIGGHLDSAYKAALGGGLSAVVAAVVVSEMRYSLSYRWDPDGRIRLDLPQVELLRLLGASQREVAMARQAALRARLAGRTINAAEALDEARAPYLDAIRAEARAAGVDPVTLRLVEVGYDLGAVAGGLATAVDNGALATRLAEAITADRITRPAGSPAVTLIPESTSVENAPAEPDRSMSPTPVPAKNRRSSVTAKIDEAGDAELLAKLATIRDAHTYSIRDIAEYLHISPARATRLRARLRADLNGSNG